MKTKTVTKILFEQNDYLLFVWMKFLDTGKVSLKPTSYI